MNCKLILTIFIAATLNACSAKIETKSMYGEYSFVLNGIENILIILPNGTYTQKKNRDGKVTVTNSGVWKDYSPEDDDIRYSLEGFQFPSKKSSGEWHAQLGRTWGKLSLCYFYDGQIEECYIKRKHSS